MTGDDRRGPGRTEDRPGPARPADGLAETGSPSTESRFLASTIAAYGSQLGRVVIRLVADLTLARLVLAESHGLFDYAWAAVWIASIVRDLGLPYQLVRDERGPFGTVLAWEAAAGTVLTAALVVGSPLFAALDPELPAVVAGIAPWLLLHGLAVVPQVWFERRLEVGRLVLPEIVRGLSFAGVSIGLAAAGYGVWSFVAGELVGQALLTGMLWWRASGRIPLTFDRRLLPDLIGRSRYLFAVAFCATTLPYLERFIVGPFVSTFIVAQYGKARLWGLKVQTVLVPAIQRVLYPALVEYRDDPGRSSAAYRVGTLTILAFEAVAAYFLFFNAETVLVGVLGPQWAPAVPLLRVLCFLPFVDPFSRLGGELLKVRNEDRAWLVIVVLNFASLVGFGTWLSSRHGAMGLVVADFLLLGNALMAWRVWRILGRDFRRLAADLLLVYLAPLVPFLVVVVLLPEEGWLRFGASLIAAAAALGLLALRFQRPFRRFFAGGVA